MANLVEADRGQVHFAAPPEGLMRPAAFVFQNFALFPWLTVRGNLELPLHNLSRDERKERVDNMLDVANLGGFEEAFPKELGSGMKQRVSLCRALISDPMVMFMDEPFGNLDALSAQSL